MTAPSKSQALAILQQEAWIGDAVLELHARAWVLAQGAGLDAECKKRMTCNAFLNALGPPTEVEARIGRIYLQQGLEAAHAYVDEHLLPLFLKQEAKRKARPGMGRR